MSQALFAETLTGVITDGFTREPLIGVTVLNLDNNSGTITDFDGAFSLDVTSLPAQYRTIHGCDSTYTLYLTVEDKEEGLPFTEADQVSVQKVVINGTLYIRKGDELFDLSGRKAR